VLFDFLLDLFELDARGDKVFPAVDRCGARPSAVRRGRRSLPLPNVLGELGAALVAVNVHAVGGVEVRLFAREEGASVQMLRRLGQAVVAVRHDAHVAPVQEPAAGAHRLRAERALVVRAEERRRDVVGGVVAEALRVEGGRALVAA